MTTFVFLNAMISYGGGTPYIVPAHHIVSVEPLEGRAHQKTRINFSWNRFCVSLPADEVMSLLSTPRPLFLTTLSVLSPFTPVRCHELFEGDASSLSGLLWNDIKHVSPFFDPNETKVPHTRAVIESWSDCRHLVTVPVERIAQHLRDLGCLVALSPLPPTPRTETQAKHLIAA